MGSVSLRMADMQRWEIPIGYVNENLHTQVRIDCKKMFDEYPNAVVSLAVLPPKGDAYPDVVTRDGDWIIWNILAHDVQYGFESKGAFQLTFTSGEIVAKSPVGRFKVTESIVPKADAPDPIADWIAEANIILGEIPVTIAESVDNALEVAKESGEFDGKDGADGQDGFSPIVQITDIAGGHRVTITDAEGAHTYDVLDGADGQNGKDGKDGHDGADGADGHTPVITASKSGKVTTIFVDGVDIATISDGTDGASIDDSTVSTESTWSSKKIDDENSALKTEINSKYEKPQTGIPASDLESGVIPAVPVQDVKVNGTSILDEHGVADVPTATAERLGVLKANGAYGLGANASGLAYVQKASSTETKTGVHEYRPIVPLTQHESVFYGLAKLAGADMASSSNPVGQFTDDALVKIQKMLGIYQAPWELIREDTFTNDTEAEHEITVDGNGDSFELTDVIFLIETPKQNNEAALGTYGRILFYYGVDYLRAQVGQWTQQSNASANGAWVKITDEFGLIQIENSQASVTANGTTLRGLYVAGFSGDNQSIQQISNFAVNKIKISSIKGTGHYKIYGRRKWN